MKHAFLGLLGLVLFCSTGCVRSVHPFYIDSQLTYDPSLVGMWVSDAEMLIVTGDADNKQFKVFYIDKDKKESELCVHLAKVQDQFFIDTTIDELPNQSDLTKGHLIPAHTFALIEIKPNQVTLRAMDSKWLENLLKADPTAIKHEKLDDEILLTAPSDQLSAFMLKHRNTAGAYGEQGVYRRVEPVK